MAGQNKILRLLKLLYGEKNPEKRQEIIELSRKTLMKWFLIGANNLLKGSIPVDKQTQRFIEKHREDLKVIADKKANEDNRLKAVLKRGGAGFLGGVIIRNLLKWNMKKEKIAKPRKSKSKKAITKKLSKKDFVKTPSLRKDLPDWVQEQVDLYRQDRNQKNQGDLDATLPYAEEDAPTFPILSAKAIQKMDRAMQGPIGAARTSDNVMTSTPIKATHPPPLFDDVIEIDDFPIQSPSTPRLPLKLKKKSKKSPMDSPNLKYFCPYDGVGFRLKENYDRHMATAHNPAWIESQSKSLTKRKIVPVPDISNFTLGFKKPKLNYYCPDCHMAFRLKSEFEKHTRRYHPVAVPWVQNK